MKNKLLFEETFKRKFSIAYREIEKLKSKIHEKKGLSIFKTHLYTKDDLLKSEHHHKIYSVSEKIHDDVVHWIRNNMFTNQQKRIYTKERDKFEQKLNSVNSEIAQRQPTWWENCKQVCIEFKELVMNNIPRIITQLLVSRILSLLLGHGKQDSTLLIE